VKTGIPGLSNLSCTTIVGSDEAGFGSWAGPLYACAVAVDCSWDGDPQIKDSKKLSKAQREKVFERYWGDPRFAVGVGVVESWDIDTLGAHKALKLAHRKAIYGTFDRLTCKPTVVVDGIVDPELNQEDVERLILLPKADNLVPAVSLASIFAKVLRDRRMSEYDLEYPGYNFTKHSGYGVPEHSRALELRGPCKIHRFSYAPIARLSAETPWWEAYFDDPR
jgi:ribonuclease HII